MMEDWEFKYAINNRLQIPLAELSKEGIVCRACKKPVDKFGAHAHVCPKLQGGRTGRAKAHQRALRAVAREAGLEVLPGESPADVYLDRKPGGSEDKQVNRRFDVGITLTKQNTRTTELVDLKFTATTKGGAAAKPNEKPGDAATVAELGKVQFYNRTFQPHANGPKVAIRGFAQETEGPLGGYAKTLLKACAKATPAHGMPGQCPEALRYRYILERFSVLAQKSSALALRHYLCKHGPNAPAQNTPEATDTPADEEEEEEDDGVDGAEAEDTPLTGPPSDSGAE